MKLKLLTLLTGVLYIPLAFPLPTNWSGTAGFDTNSISNFRKTKDSCVNYGFVNGTGTDDLKPDSCENAARFQTYKIRLRPEIVINDSATIFSEISLAGFMGEDSSAGGDPASNPYYSTSNDQSNLTATRLYAELYAGVGLVRVGRFSKEFALGAVLNKGEDIFDPYFSKYDGLEVDFKLGSLTVTPYWGKISSNEKTPNGSHEVTEKGISALYHNINTNLKVGLLYAARRAEKKNKLNQGVDDGTGTLLGPGFSDTTLIDFFLKKEGEKYSVALEIPMIKGDFKDMYDQKGKHDYEGNAAILESTYKLGSRWDTSLKLGQVSGYDGKSKTFSSMSLHPNYQIANILYAYNYQGFIKNEYDIYQRGISNSQFARLAFHWTGEVWEWDMAFITAKAQETAQKGKDYYDHEIGRMIKNGSGKSQDNNLGTEFDFSFIYNWNPNVVVGGNLSYLKTGDYFKQNGTAKEFSIESVMAMGLNLGLRF